MITRNELCRHATALIAAIAPLWAATANAEPNAQTLYNSYCIACHGAEMNAGIGGSLVDAEWKYAKTDAEIVALIQKGIPEKGMVSFEKILSEKQINDLVKLIRSKALSSE